MTKAVELAQVASTGVSEAFKNRIINGQMVIDQRNAGASVTQTNALAYTLDRWRIFGSVTSKFTVQQNAGSVTPPDGFRNYLGVTSSAATTLAASDAYRLEQPIEGFNVADLGFGTANAKTITASFWVRSSLTGTFGGALWNVDATRAYVFSYTISSANTWEYKTVTIAGDTTGTWVGATNGQGLVLQFSMGAGSDNLGTAGSWSSTFKVGVTGQVNVVGTNGASWYVTGCQLEIGSTATSFDYRPYTTELQLCQRYALMIASSEGDGAYIRFGSGQNYSTTACECSVFLPVKMRTYPSLTASATASVYQIYANNSGIGCNTSPILRGQGNSPLIACLSTTVASGLTAGQACSITGNGSTSAYLLYTAEL